MYKLGDTYYAARSTEFGYVNYEIVPKPSELLPLIGKDLLPKSSQEKEQARYLHVKDQE